MGRKTRWLLLFAGLASIAGCSSCGEKTPDEEVIGRMVESAVVLAEAHDIAGIMELAAENFRADPGGYDARGAKMVLFMTFRRYGKFRIHYPTFPVTVSDDRNSAQVELLFAVLREDMKVPTLDEAADDPVRWLDEATSNFEPYRLRLELVRVGDEEWKVTRARVDGARTLGR